MFSFLYMSIPVCPDILCKNAHFTDSYTSETSIFHMILLHILIVTFDITLLFYRSISYIYIYIYMYVVHPWHVNHPYWCHLDSMPGGPPGLPGRGDGGFLVACGVLNSLWHMWPINAYIYIHIHSIYIYWELYSLTCKSPSFSQLNLPPIPPPSSIQTPSRGGHRVRAAAPGGKLGMFPWEKNIPGNITGWWLQYMVSIWIIYG